ncbi:MAG: glycosyltransferase family 2 protein [Bacteroidales bacterium]|nr:glycosyltransferase family 2 protein [Bacteroidales bacterium]MDY6348674.1 glycosyltransferase family 2 protein [Bacteroidales bacterium]
MLKLAVVILNWNGREFLERFLPPLLRTLPDYAEVVVCDNASTDDSVAFMRENHPGVRLLQNERNEGFARGYNLALNQIEAEYFCLLNSDIEVTENWIEPVIEQMDAQENLAAVQPKLLSYRERDEFEYSGACGGYIDKYGYPFCRGRVFGNLEKDHGQYDNVADIFWASGAALFVRSDVYRTMGGLDDDFFAHMEEIDFCWRIKNVGYSIKVNPKSVVYHIGGGTLPKNNSMKTFLNFRNSLYLLAKNLPDDRLARTLVLRFFLDQVAAFSFLLQGHFKDFVAVYKAIFTFARTYRKFLAKRNTMPKIAFKDCYPKSVVALHYLKRKTKFDGKSFS